MWRVSARHVRLGCVALLLAAGCRSATGSDDGGADQGPWRRRVGLVDLFAGDLSSEPLVAPAEAVRGEPFEVTVITRGSSSCTRASGAEVQYGSGRTVAVVTPYDEYYETGGPCTADLAPFPRQATLRFDAVGTARIRLVARVAGLETVDPNTPVIVTERAVTVREPGAARR